MKSKQKKLSDNFVKEGEIINHKNISFYEIEDNTKRIVIFKTINQE